MTTILMDSLPGGKTDARCVRALEMAVNSDKPDRWTGDIARSVDLYNDWFMRFAPKAYRDTRAETTTRVRQALASMADLTDISAATLR